MRACVEHYRHHFILPATALRLLDTVDKAAADDFRRSVALDASGVLVSKLGGKNTDTVYAHTGEHPKSES